MRRICYQVAMSLDGFIAGPGGEYDWIVPDPDIDFPAMFARFDTLLMGRRTYEPSLTMGPGAFFGKEVVVVSRTLDPAAHPDVEIVADRLAERVSALKAKPGKDIWLFGGGALFRSLLDLDLVDTVEAAVVPVLLGGGIPLLPARARRATLKLTGRRVYEKTGTVLLQYDVQPGAPRSVP